MSTLTERVRALPPLTLTQGQVLEAAAVLHLVQDSRLVGGEREFTIGESDGADPGNTAVPVDVVRWLRDRWELIEPVRVLELADDEGGGLFVRYGLTRLGAAVVAFSRSRREQLVGAR